MACKDCFNARMTLKRVKKIKRLGFGNPNKTMCWCCKDWWQDAGGKSRILVLRSVLSDGELVRNAYKTCPNKDEEDMW